MTKLIIVINLIILSVKSLQPDNWKVLTSGIEIQNLGLRKYNGTNDPEIIIVRIDPNLWELTFEGISQSGDDSIRTAKEWCKNKNLTAAINAGMFSSDYKTHTGYLKYKDHINSKNINNYQSVMAFNPHKDKNIPLFHIFDLDTPGTTIESIKTKYNSVIQNLRLIKKPGINVWNKQERMWSEAAIGEDKNGRILFIFSRSPFSMHDLNDVLLKSEIGIVAAQHLEGGPEAQIYLKIGDFELDLCGSYETSFNENNNNNIPWEIPNIIGIRQR
jgi:hypothetical protein